MGSNICQQEKRRYFTPIIKVVGSGCNLRCRYCFYRKGEHNIELMDDNMLQLVIRRSLEFPARRFKFIWHGGEPLLAGLKFYQRVIELQDRFTPEGVSVVNSIQTNATLLTSEWTQFFKRTHFEVGVSVDGPRFLHDMCRVDKQDKETFLRVMNGVKLLRAEGIKPGIVAVIHSATIEYPKEIFDFFYDQGLSFAANACIGNSPFAATPQGYARFMQHLFDMWIKEDDPKFRIRPLKTITKGILGLRQTFCKYTGSCGDFVTIWPNGDVFPCDDFSECSITFGNIKRSSLAEIIGSTQAQDFLAKRDFVTNLCSNCHWFSVCRGGCLREWIFDTDRPYNRFCGFRKDIFRYVKEKLIEMGEI